MPDVEVVRYIAEDEYGQVRAQCLTDAGFPTTAGDDGGLGGSFTRDRAQEHALANYVCAAKFPLDPKYQVPLTADQVSVLYDYFVDALIPCLVDHGHMIGEPPTREGFFRDFAEGRQWTPYLDLGRDAALSELEKACPSVPDDLVE
ncbi:hypothetical protein N1031_07365 [Herbiconiux moechotypicola]|uniref:hypothetical protein n=1 Tax=Herbiconiux moechotypicola TaxID=637393 RepID=UPI00217D9C97|nr:hypothetical protein [Herbiconiux moechotypicola]MCS5729576.1 hypothetical protein [Herbiconiux moechotypicola]